jgi:serine/threonine-protein kinase HipA
MKEINILIKNKKVGELFYDKQNREYGFNYSSDFAPISLTMPYQKKSYLSSFDLHPIFEMNMPEGYLFEIFKNFLSKEYGYMDDFLVLAYLAPNIESRLTFKSEFEKRLFRGIDIEEILENDSDDTFLKLLHTFLDKNAISGVQPKTLALIKDKETLSTKEYIVKTWGEEYPYLAENEYFSMKAVERAGVQIPNIELSKHKKFLLVEKFNYDKEADTFLGFEEVLVLLGKNRNKKYSGSYEQVAKLIYAVTTKKIESMTQFYKTILMNYLLKNGDAHLKNFGVLYDNDFKNIYFSPAYDIVNTTAYVFKDKPALMMFGKKVWWGKAELLRFGVEHCSLSNAEAKRFYAEAIEVLKESIVLLEEYVLKNPTFKTIGQRMIDSWKLSLDEKTYKEMPNEIDRHWKKG